MLCHVQKYVSHDAREIHGLISGHDQRRACEQEQFKKMLELKTASFNFPIRLRIAERKAHHQHLWQAHGMKELVSKK